MKRVRKIHLYLGMLFAPAIVSFAITGAIQTLGLHEAKKGDTRSPPVWIVRLAEVHKNQRLVKPPKPANDSDQRSTAQQPSATTENSAHLGAAIIALKIWIVFMAAGLVATTLLGIYMSFKYHRDKRIVLGLLLIGAALPITLLLL